MEADKQNEESETKRIELYLPPGDGIGEAYLQGDEVITNNGLRLPIHITSLEDSFLGVIRRYVILEGKGLIAEINEEENRTKELGILAELVSRIINKEKAPMYVERQTCRHTDFQLDIQYSRLIPRVLSGLERKVKSLITGWYSNTLVSDSMSSPYPMTLTLSRPLIKKDGNLSTRRETSNSSSIPGEIELGYQHDSLKEIALKVSKALKEIREYKEVDTRIFKFKRANAIKRFLESVYWDTTLSDR